MLIFTLRDMYIEGVPCIELLYTVFTCVHKTIGEMLRLNVVDNVGAGLMLESIANDTIMVSTVIFRNKVFKVIMALGLRKAYKRYKIFISYGIYCYGHKTCSCH